MQVNVKKIHEDVQLPVYATEGAACFDLHAYLPDGPITLYPGNTVNISTGLIFEVPEGYVLKIYSRSGHGFKNRVRLINAVGIIDSDFRAEVRVGLISDYESETGHPKPLVINNGDRIAQGMIDKVERIEFNIVSEVSETARGTGGFGSTGK